VELTGIVLSFLGVVVGLALWSRIARVAMEVYGSLKGVDVTPILRAPNEKQISKLFRLLFVTSLAWMLLFGGIFAYIALSTSAAGWAWFFGGITVTPAFVLGASVYSLRRYRRNIQRAQP